MKFFLVCVFLAALFLALLAAIPDQSSGGTHLALKARNAPPAATLEEIASFYAGRPITFNWDDTTGGGSTFGAGSINMPKSSREKLLALMAALRGGNRQEMERQSVLGVDPLSVLLHESMHNRDSLQEAFGHSKRDEPQAAALGAELVPDLLQRFFGIPIGSPLSRMFARNAQSRGEYEGAYRQRGLPTPPRPR